MDTELESSDASLYRVLVVDDIRESGEVIVELLADLATEEPIVPVLVHSLSDAKQVLQERCVDFVMTDYNLGKQDPTGGLRLLEYLATLDANVDAAIYTKHFHESDFKDQAIQTVTSLSTSKVRIRAAVNLGSSTEPLELAFRAAYTDWIKRRIHLEDQIGIGEILCKAHFANWADSREALADFLRITSAIYGNAGLNKRPLEFNVTLPDSNLYDLEVGHSGAVVITPEIRFGSLATTLPPVKTVLKLGAPEPMQSERDNFRNLVAFGLPLKSRVEFLGYSRRRNLAALCYGFAGGVFGDSVLSLRSDLNRAGGHLRAQTAVRDLFTEDNKSWYGHRVENKIEQPKYIRLTNRRPIDEMLSIVNNRLTELHADASSIITKRTTSQETGQVRLSIGSVKLSPPPRTYAGSVLLVRRWPQTLVHGDMHVGNVLLELSESARGSHIQRAVLIDFADAGAGPRAEDLAALYASMALQDAKGSPVSKLSISQQRSWLADEFKADRRRLKLAFAPEAGAKLMDAQICSPSNWARDAAALEGFAAVLDELMMAVYSNFPDMVLGEFASSLLIRSLEMSIHESELIGFIRLVGLASVVSEMLPEGAGDEAGHK